MKEVMLKRFAATLPVAEKASHNPPVQEPMVILARTLREAFEQAEDAGLVLTGQIQVDGSVKPCRRTR